ncbi:Mdm20p KNAG_0K01940 [Huiozyma naganishii CBS 8797]|uniref:Uncharacterized protein n=1 Tax=Huiozyma naganishii (strain ATCC MYA-139 / BCRC 22969 / CBS 8797 / KCTC 17520 / NBRC 10181 / NCYC 3082 / Yp74L-3) TaxID=1071383 RepID=J7RRS5_HUIN7|nr:hypothetical protein KNAG_0K01940 [Kazachstania naganishii CBS 8797]CCK72558.1 hypothetical protein KNAG_0K01940 [Kazachstania naganishii CBS 8797]
MESKWESEVQELIRRSNFRQCFEQLTVLRKRYPKSAFLELLELYAKYRQSPAAFDYKALIVEPYCRDKRSPRVTGDLHALDLLHRFLVELGQFDDALHAVELAHLKFNRLDLTYDLFVKSIEDADFPRMARATSSLPGRTPRDTADYETRTRAYHFWNAIATLATFMHQRSRLSEQELKVLPKLCYQRLSQLKPHSTIQEAIVYCLVCERLLPNDNASKSAEIVETIMPHLQVSVDLYLKNFMVEHVKDPQVMFDSCAKMLSEFDDYKLIGKLIESGQQLGKTKQEIRDLVRDRVGDSRNCRLSGFEVDLCFDKRVSAGSLRHYLAKFHNKPCCAIDIEHYREHLDTPLLQEAMDELEADLIHDSNCFQLQLTPQQDAVALYKKHEHTLQGKPATDYSSLSTFIVSMVRETLRGGGSSSPLQNILTSLSILENFQLRDPHNFDTGVWIIALYMQLGLTPLAVPCYTDLKIKNVQSDSMDYTLFTRYNSIFPAKQHDYMLRVLPEHDRLYSSSMERLPQFIRIAFERGSYSKILGMFELRRKLTHSMNRWMRMVSKLQMARLCNDKRTQQLQVLHQMWAQLGAEKEILDNRDLTVFKTHGECTPEEQLSYLRCSQDWILLSCSQEFMIESITSGTRSFEVDELWTKLALSDDLDGALSAAGFTQWEALSLKVVHALYENRMAAVPQLLASFTRGSLDEPWTVPHAYLTQLTLLKTLDGCKRICDAEAKAAIKKQLRLLRESCDDQFASYKAALAAECAQTASSPLLSQLGFPVLDSGPLTAATTTVHKAVRNL